VRRPTHANLWRKNWGEAKRGAAASFKGNSRSPAQPHLIRYRMPNDGQAYSANRRNAFLRIEEADLVSARGIGIKMAFGVLKHLMVDEALDHVFGPRRQMRPGSFTATVWLPAVDKGRPICRREGGDCGAC